MKSILFVPVKDYIKSRKKTVCQIYIPNGGCNNSFGNYSFL